MANSAIWNEQSEAGGYVLYVSFWLFPFSLISFYIKFSCVFVPLLSLSIPRYDRSLVSFCGICLMALQKKKRFTKFGAFGTLSPSPSLPFTRTWHGVCLLVYLSIVFLFQRVVISFIIYCLLNFRFLRSV